MTDIRPTDAALATPTLAASPAPILDRLAANHVQMHHWLGELQRLVTHLEDRGWDTWARDHARAVIDFFGHTARQHHQEVDRHVVPLVAGRNDPALDTHVDQLRQDQGWLEETWRELLAQLQPVAEGFGGTDVDVLRQSADVYAALLQEQLAREKDVVGPAARASADLLVQGAEQRRAERAASAA